MRKYPYIGCRYCASYGEPAEVEFINSGSWKIVPDARGANNLFLKRKVLTVVCPEPFNNYGRLTTKAKLELIKTAGKACYRWDCKLYVLISELEEVVLYPD